MITIAQIIEFSPDIVVKTGFLNRYKVVEGVLTYKAIGDRHFHYYDVTKGHGHTKAVKLGCIGRKATQWFIVGCDSATLYDTPTEALTALVKRNRSN